MIDVVAALIYKDNKVLIAKRKTGDESVFGKWEFPGGKVEIEESEERAIEREIKEEFGVEIKTIKFIANNIWKYPTKTVNLKLYECKYLNGEFNLNDHSEYKWVYPSELLDYDLAPADISLAKQVRRM